MAPLTERRTATVPVTGIFNYLAPDVQSSLYRNGQVLTQRDADGSDGGTVGVVLEAHTIAVQNARHAAAVSRRPLHRHGFELLEQPLASGSIEFFDHEEVAKHYYPHCAELVQDISGGRAFAFDHNIRSASGKKHRRRILGGQQVQSPAHVVHGDYTLHSAAQRLRDLGKPPRGNDTLRAILPAGSSLIDQKHIDRTIREQRRFAIINVWRNISTEPVASHPLALCDGQSVVPEDLVVFEIHYQDRIGENYFAKFSSHHDWYYYPAMTKDEALLIKQWDSTGNLAMTQGASSDANKPSSPCTFSFHSAFEDPATPADAPDRYSIEVRCMVLYD